MKDVLLLTNNDSSEGFIKELLMRASYGKLYIAYNYADGAYLTEIHPFDLIIVNAPLRTEVGDRFAKYAALHTSAEVLFISRDALYNQHLDYLTNLGILCLKKPVVVKPFQQLIKIIEASVSKSDVMQRSINVAKWHLISSYNLTEPQAQRMLEQYALDESTDIFKAAEAALDGKIHVV